MANYRIAEDVDGAFYVVKVGGQGGCKATILPPTPRMVAKTFCESVEDIVQLESFDEVKNAHPRSLGAFVRTQ